METPNLDRIVDTYVLIEKLEYGPYLDQLRRDIIPPIRRLQAEGTLRWYAFLVHPPDLLDKREPLDTRRYIHLRLEVDSSIEVNEFIGRLPLNFRKPEHKRLAEIDGLDQMILCDHDWASAWKIHGEASGWVLTLLEHHENVPIPEHQVFQFLHFMTNSLFLFDRCA